MHRGPAALYTLLSPMDREAKPSSLAFLFLRPGEERERETSMKPQEHGLEGGKAYSVWSCSATKTSPISVSLKEILVN